MKLSIVYLPNLNRPWLLKREHGEYSQHAHFYTKKEALCCRKLIDANKFPRDKKYRIAMQRLLTDEEYKGLNKKSRFYKKNCGVIR